MLRKVLFRGGSGGGGCSGPVNVLSGDLLEPAVLPALAGLLQPNLPANLLVKTLKLLKTAAECAGNEHLQAWHTVVFRLVPLLRAEPGVCEAALNVLLRCVLALV